VKTIYKYALKATDVQTIELPLGSQLLSAKEQRNDIMLYALVETDEDGREEYNILAYGTGHDITTNLSDYSFLDTVLLQNDGLVFHFFYKRVR